MQVENPIPRNFTGFLGGICYVDGVPAKDVAARMRPGVGLTRTASPPEPEKGWCRECKTFQDATTMINITRQRGGNVIGICKACYEPAPMVVSPSERLSKMENISDFMQRLNEEASLS